MSRESYLPDIHRLLPQSPDAEQGILSSLLLAPVEVGLMCQQREVDSLWFHIPSHRVIFDNIMEMWDVNLPIDVITLSQRLRDRNLLDNCGGPAFVTQLFTFLPTAANAAYYIDIVQQKKILRNVVEVCTEYAARSYDEQHNIAELVEGLEAAATNIGSTSQRNSRCLTGSIIESVRGRVDESALEISDAVPTGIATWDDSIGWLRPKRTVLIGARYGIGKTALMETMAANQARAGLRVVFFQRDMSPEDMLARMACRRAGVVFEDFDRGRLPGELLTRVRRALDEIDTKKLRIHSPPVFNSHTVKSIVKQELMSGPVACVFLDVFQKLRSDRRLGMAEDLSQQSQGLRDMATDLSVPLVMAAHLNRDAHEGRPNGSQIRYCDAPAGDCDTVVLLWSEEDPKTLVDTRTGTYRRQDVVMTVEKNRGGFVGDEHLYFDRPKIRFYEHRVG